MALEHLDRANQAKEILDSEGLTFTTETTGAMHARPEVRIERDARAAFARIWAQLSLEWYFQIDGRD